MSGDADQWVQALDKYRPTRRRNGFNNWRAENSESFGSSPLETKSEVDHKQNGTRGTLYAQDVGG
ncbi:MAG: hypothetical protein R3B96_06620 [Pirellulaceae bacterium]